MGDKTGISWTNATWNPLRGCSPVSPGCKNCYAANVAKRFSGTGEPFEGLVRINAARERTNEWNGRIRFVEEHLLDPIRWKRPRRIFVNSVSDLFHENVSDEIVDKIFAVMALAPQHTFQVLTKRPERMMGYIVSRQRSTGTSTCAALARVFLEICGRALPEGFKWPLPNAWLGTSVENQKYADNRIPFLIQTPAAVRFISAEPLLGPIHIGDGLDWVIVGGESQPGSRPMHPDWARDLRDQCKSLGIPFFFKQWGDWTPDKPESFIKVSGKRYSHETFAWATDGSQYNSLNPPYDHFPSLMVYRVGARSTGDFLDGVQHHEYPEAR